MHNDSFLDTHNLLPMYSVKSYENGLYRVVRNKRIYASVYHPKKDSESSIVPDGKFASALSRAKSTAREYGLCNRWDYFVTLTLDKQKVDRYDLVPFLREFFQWIQNENKKGANIEYLLVPEQHKDGAWHLHGLMRGIDVSPQPPGTPRDIVATGYDCWLPFSLRYGFSTVSPVVSNVGCGFYITKYITKSLAGLASLKGIHCYYHSRGLRKSIVVGFRYSYSDILNRCAKYETKWCNFGFFKVDEIDRVAALLDDFGDSFQRFVVCDPSSGDVVAVSSASDPAAFWEIILGDQLQFYEDMTA